MGILGLFLKKIEKNFDASCTLLSFVRVFQLVRGCSKYGFADFVDFVGFLRSPQFAPSIGADLALFYQRNITTLQG